MKTLGELVKVIQAASLDVDLFGYDEELVRGFRERCKAIGPALSQEQNVSPAEVSRLPADTLLGENSRALAENLKNWFTIETASKK